MFYVGQKVERIRDLPAVAKVAHLQWSNVGGHLPAPGVVYTVRKIWVGREGYSLLHLVEIDNSHLLAAGWPEEPGFSAKYFRPVVERKTSIEIFTAMLNPADKRVEA